MQGLSGSIELETPEAPCLWLEVNPAVVHAPKVLNWVLVQGFYI